MISDKRPSRMICRGAFDTAGNKAKSHGVLKMWAINDPSKKTIRTKSYKLIKANHIVNELTTPIGIGPYRRTAVPNVGGACV